MDKLDYYLLYLRLIVDLLLGLLDMSNFLDIFQPYWIVPTIIFIFIPTIIAVVIRCCLYRHILNSANKVSRLLSSGNNRSRKPEIVNQLETRFRQASQKLETVNTMALIDRLYSQERLKVLGLSLPCEQWDYFCQTFPSLLLSFGLIGTFIGITLNLYSISQTINQSSQNINVLLEQLQTPLQSMGIAFCTSLAAIVFSSVLIIINICCNTTFAKTLLISSLEDYLDNIYKVNIKGYSRLDHIVDRMSEQQEKFLTHFLGKLQQSLENSITRATSDIILANQEFQENVDSLVRRFNNVSTTMAESTDGFKEAVSSLEQQITTVNKMLPQFAASSNKLEASAKLHLKASQKIEQSKFSEDLEQLTSDLTKAQQSFSQSTKYLGEQGSQLVSKIDQLINNNQTSHDIAKKVYTQLQEASSTIQESAVDFLEATENLTTTDFVNKLSNATQELMTIPQRFKKSTEILHQSTNNIAIAINKINNSAKHITSLVETNNELNQYSHKLLESGDRNFKSQNVELVQIVSQLNKHQLVVNDTMKKFGKVLNIFQLESGNNIQQLQKVTHNFNLELRNINDNNTRILASFDQQTIKNNQEVSNLVAEFKQAINQISTIPSEISKSIEQIIEQLQKEQESLNLNTEFSQVIKQLNNIPLEISKLIDSIEQSKIEVENNEDSFLNKILNNKKNF